MVIPTLLNGIEELNVNNEWFKAKCFKKQYWLYIVENAAINPTLSS